MTPIQCTVYCFAPSYIPTEYSFFDIGSEKPALTIARSSFSQSFLLQLLRHNPDLQVSCYFSGDYLQEASGFPDELAEIKKYIANGQIEPLLGTYHHSLSCLLSLGVFKQEIDQHRSMLKDLFDVKPRGFYNTLAIFSDDLVAKLVEEKISYTLAPRIAWYAGGQSPDSDVFDSKHAQLKLILIGTYKRNKSIVVRHLPGDSKEPIQLKSITAYGLVKKKKSSTTYLLPTAAGIDTHGNDLNYYLGNALQKQVFRSLKSLSSAVEKHADTTLSQHLLQLSSPSVFGLLTDETKERLTYYNYLTNILADMELKATTHPHL